MNLLDLDKTTLQAWQASPELRAEFGSFETFRAYSRALERGNVRISQPRVITGRREDFVRPAGDAAGRFTLDAVVAFAANGSPQGVGVDARGSVTGYAAIFGGKNRRGFRLLPGAFRTSVSRVPVPMLWGHDSNRVVGRWDALHEDARGLVASGTLNLKIGDGLRAFELLRGRDVTGLSVGFRAKPEDYKESKDDGAIEVALVELLEISLAPVPAEDLARVTHVMGD